MKRYASRDDIETVICTYSVGRCLSTISASLSYDYQCYIRVSCSWNLWTIAIASANNVMDAPNLTLHLTKWVCTFNIVALLIGKKMHAVQLPMKVSIIRTWIDHIFLNHATDLGKYVSILSNLFIKMAAQWLRWCSINLALGVGPCVYSGDIVLEMLARAIASNTRNFTWFARAREVISIEL